MDYSTTFLAKAIAGANYFQDAVAPEAKKDTFASHVEASMILS